MGGHLKFIEERSSGDHRVLKFLKPAAISKRVLPFKIELVNVLHELFFNLRLFVLRSCNQTLATALVASHNCASIQKQH